MFKSLFRLFTFGMLLSTMVLVSCEKEAGEDIQNFTDLTLQSTLSESQEAGNQCFNFVYPIGINNDGDIVTFDDHDSFRSYVKEFIKENDRNGNKPSLVFPLDIIKDGETITLNSDAELQEVKKECPKRSNRGKGHRGARNKGSKCFSFIYPLTLVFPDGTNLEVADREAAHEAKVAFKEANPDAEERPSIQFPVSVTLEDGSESVLADEAALNELVEDCGHRGKGKRRRGLGQKCFSLSYPVTIIFSDGSTAEVADRKAAKEAHENYKEANPDSTERPSLQFPVEVTLEDGTLSTIDSEESLKSLAESCRDNNDGE